MASQPLYLNKHKAALYSSIEVDNTRVLYFHGSIRLGGKWRWTVSPTLPHKMDKKSRAGRTVADVKHDPKRSSLFMVWYIPLFIQIQIQILICKSKILNSYNTVGIKSHIKLSIQMKVQTNFNGDGVKCDLMCAKCRWVAMQLVVLTWFVLTYQAQIKGTNTNTKYMQVVTQLVWKMTQYRSC